jgi:hypothetical protein
VQSWLRTGKNTVEVLERDPLAAEHALEQLQVTTRSPLGAVAYHTAGILIDHGWVRVLGSGRDRISGSLISWNALGGHPPVADTRGMLLVAHDVLGGFFALDGGGLGEGRGNAFYFAPDSLRWADLERGYSDVLRFLFDGDLSGFYGDYRWPGWEKEVVTLSPDSGFSIYPPLWTKEGKELSRVSRKPVPMTELLQLELEMARQLEGSGRSRC